MSPAFTKSAPRRAPMRPPLLGLPVSSPSAPSSSFSCRRASSGPGPSAKASFQLQKRNVAGSFIFRFAEDSPDRGPQVALFRRSAEVRTYQHKWAPISGSVETSDANPLAAAWRELAEETGLTPGSLRFLRRGKPYSYSDASIGREWTINPFAFAIQPGAAGNIRLDWEHEAYDWFNPVDLLTNHSLQTVPRLTDSLRRVWFEIELGPDPAAALESGLRDLRRHGEGAGGSTHRTPCRRALRAFFGVLATLDTPSTERWWRNLRVAAWHLSYNGTLPINTWVIRVLLGCMSVLESRLPSGRAIPAGFANDICNELREFTRGAYGLDDGVEQEEGEEKQETEYDHDLGEMDIFSREKQQQHPEQRALERERRADRKGVEVETRQPRTQVVFEEDEDLGSITKTREKRFFSDL